MGAEINHFDEPINRFETQAAKFKKEYLIDIFGTTDLYPFWIADQDFKSPPEVLKALHQRVDEGVFGYECRSKDYKNIQVEWFKKQYRCSIKPYWINTTPTIMSSMAMTLDLFTPENGKVIIQPPVYKEFSNTITKTNRKILENPLELVGNYYQMDFDHLNKTLEQGNIDAIIICNPHNPVGRVWNREELQKLVTICQKFEILIISDEIHADIVFKGHKFTSLLAFPEIHNQLVVLYSPSKLFNIASISDSICIIPNAKKRSAFENLQNRYNLGRPNAFTQIATSVGYLSSKNWVQSLNEYLELNVLFISHYIQDHIPQLSLIKQDGTYLVWIDVSALPLHGDQLIKYLAKEAGIGLSDGQLFGSQGKGFVRMNISCPHSVIQQAMKNLAKAVKKMDL